MPQIVFDLPHRYLVSRAVSGGGRGGRVAGSVIVAGSVVAWCVIVGGGRGAVARGRGVIAENEICGFFPN